MLELATICIEIYVPNFNENSGEYVDKSPYKPYQRKCIEYECRCKAGSSFFNNASYKQHIKSNTHKLFIDNYPKYFKEVDEATETIKQLRIENEMLKRKYEKAHNKISEIQMSLDDDNFHDC